MTFRLASVSGRATLVDGDALHDLEGCSGGAFGPDPMAAVAGHVRLHEIAAGLAGREPTGALAGAALDAPVPRPTNVFAIGLNYRSHAAEAGMAHDTTPDVPLVFTKFPSCISAPDTDVALESDTVDHEVELVVAIGTGGKDIAEGDAWDHVAGVTIGQDISDRALQFAATPPHFDLAKSRDTYGPIGPVLVSTDAFDDPDDLTLTCDVDGERRQHASTRDMIFPVPALIAYLSSILTLSPGDLIFTGTPAGVGMATGRYLVPGAVITSTIDGVGTITNRCT
jgi:2-keto-4-pentenoate hydratase/2-oxohepta-3-ene-1,7-dioic acid hydratase in catechol pathway